MIARLRGTIRSSMPSQVQIDVQGVVYEVLVSLSSYGSIPPAGQECELFTYLSFRQDTFTLFGFHTKEEKTMFCLLTTVKNVGPKIALSILSVLQPQRVRQCILIGDAVSLARSPGLGKKTAQRIILELKDRLGGTQVPVEGVMDASVLYQDERFRDAVGALVALGYRDNEACSAVGKIYEKKDQTGNLTVEDIVRGCLKNR